MTERGTIYRFWTLLGIIILAIMSLGGLLVLLGRGPGAAAPAVKRTPTLLNVRQVAGAIPSDAAIAIVNGEPIRYGNWREAALLDQVMGGLAGQTPPSNAETLDRMINEVLVLQAVSLDQPPTDDQVENRIAQMEASWGVGDAAVRRALDTAGLDRTAFEEAVRRLLVVEAALEVVKERGQEPAAWLEEQRASAGIQLVENVAALPVADASAVTAAPTLPPPTATPTYPLATDFTLQRAGGGSLTLTEQLAEGAVVLAFIQRCG